MTTCLGKGCSFGLPRVPSVYVFSCFPFGFEGRMWDLIVSVPDHCLCFYFTESTERIRRRFRNDYKELQKKKISYNLFLQDNKISTFYCMKIHLVVRKL